MFPVAIIYLLARVFIHMFEIIPKTLFQADELTQLGGVALVAIVVFFFSMGSFYLAMIILIISALWYYIGSCVKIWQTRKATPELTPLKKFQIIFLVLWLASGVATMFWTSSTARMRHHLSYSAMSSAAWAYYAENVLRYEEQIKAELRSACASPHEIDNPLVLSGLFFSASKLKDLSVAPCVAKLLTSNTDERNDVFFEEGLSCLESSDKAVLIRTCITLLDSGELSGKTPENIDDRYGERLSLVLSYLINNGRQNEYKRFITKNNIDIMRAYRYQRDGRSKNRIGLKYLNLDLESFDMGSKK